MGEKSFKDILWRIFRFVFLGFMALISVRTIGMDRDVIL